MPSYALVQPFPCRIFLDPVIAGSKNMHIFFTSRNMAKWPSKTPVRVYTLGPRSDQQASNAQSLFQGIV